jgi:two-component system CheB/CheR fusion protein
MKNEMRAPPDPAFDSLLEFLRQSRAFDFNAYKKPTLMRRVLRRMQSVGIDGFTAYQDYLEAHPEEVAHLFNMILINVTSFFRDQPVWQYLEQVVVPELVTRLGDGETIRVWSAACASGEEACSLAMLFANALGAERFRERVKIYATDVDEDALNHARAAAYSERDVQCLGPEMLERYFERADGRFVFNKDLRRSVIFGRHDLLQDAPISRVNLLTCRNTLMYFNADAQARVLERFEFALAPGGYLVMGKAEMLPGRLASFVPVDLKRRVFVKLQGSSRDRPAPRVETGDAADGDSKLRALALQADPVAQLIVDRERVIVAVNERARSLFGIRPGDVGRPIQDLEISYQPLELRSLIDRALGDGRTVSARDIEWTAPTGEIVALEAQILPLVENGAALGVKVTFPDVTQYRRLQHELNRSNQEREAAYEELQSTNEELETTNEELQSTIEELETTNEELQSTNEELETMNEELQSTNEELHDANTELQERSDALNRANGLLEGILRTLEEGVIVVDRELRVQAWNARAYDLWGLRADEVTGRHLVNLDIGLPVEQLVHAVRACLNGETEQQHVTVTALTRRGRRLQMRVACSALTLPPPLVRSVILLMTEQAAELERAGD